MSVTADTLDNVMLSAKPRRRRLLLRRLRAQGWTVRLKSDRDQNVASSADSLATAIHAALAAYQRTGRAGGEGDLPCRAAIRAYQRIRPNDTETSERVVRALVMAMRKWPAAFGRPEVMVQ
jgi:hypothetical protein